MRFTDWAVQEIANTGWESPANAAAATTTPVSSSR